MLFAGATNASEQDCMNVALDRCRVERMVDKARDQRQRARFEHRFAEVLERRGDIGKHFPTRGIDNRHAAARVNNEASLTCADMSHAPAGIQRPLRFVDNENNAQSGHRARSVCGLLPSVLTLVNRATAGTHPRPLSSRETRFSNSDHIPAVGLDPHRVAEHL